MSNSSLTKYLLLLIVIATCVCDAVSITLKVEKVQGAGGARYSYGAEFWTDRGYYGRAGGLQPVGGSQKTCSDDGVFCIAPSGWTDVHLWYAGAKQTLSPAVSAPEKCYQSGCIKQWTYYSAF